MIFLENLKLYLKLRKFNQVKSAIKKMNIRHHSIANSRLRNNSSYYGSPYSFDCFIPAVEKVWKNAKF
jgi:hypothetical protein